MKPSLKFLTTLLIIAVTQGAYAQNAEMADTFRSEGKIYVVVAIILIVLAGLVAYLFILDRKMTRLERTTTITLLGTMMKMNVTTKTRTMMKKTTAITSLAICLLLVPVGLPCQWTCHPIVISRI